MSTTVAIVGATGRMGTLISRLVNESSEFALGAQLGSKGELASILGADIVVDVTAPGPSQKVVEYAVSNGMNVLVGTSGWSRERIASLGHEVALQPGVGVIIVPNFSIGSSVR